MKKQGLMEEWGVCMGGGGGGGRQVRMEWVAGAAAVKGRAKAKGGLAMLLELERRGMDCKGSWGGLMAQVCICMCVCVYVYIYTYVYVSEHILIT
jgi:hypothetical protein